MRISCILTSYNRPNFMRQALRSVERQTFGDYELLVVDDSDPEILDVVRVVGEFLFPAQRIWPCCGRVDGRREKDENRLAVQVNRALREATGDLICYLADDDYLDPDWFAEGARFFEEHPEVLQAYGSLLYSHSPNMDYSQTGAPRFPEGPVWQPRGSLDHNQVMHRRRVPPVLWPERAQARNEPDGFFFQELALEGPFYPIPTAVAAVKRIHPKCLQRSGEDRSGARE